MKLIRTITPQLIISGEAEDISRERACSDTCVFSKNLDLIPFGWIALQISGNEALQYYILNEPLSNHERT